MPSRRPRAPADPLREDLIEAACRGDLARTQGLLSRGAKPDAIVDDVGPLICSVARNRHWEVVFALARAGADVNSADRGYGYTPLNWAVLAQSLDAVRTLLQVGADPHRKDRWGNMALMKACSGIGLSGPRLDPGFCREVARLFLEAGCDPDEPNAGGMTPRMTALDPHLRGPVGDLFRDLPPHGGRASAPPAANTAPAQPAPSSAPAPASSTALAPADDAAPTAARRVESLVRAGVATRAEMLEILVDELGAESDADGARVAADLDRQIARKAIEERSWPAVLDTDRLDRAFDALEGLRVVCLHDAGYTQSDGYGDAEERRDEEGGDESGFDAYCFYHRQDVEGALDGRGLYIAFGSFRTQKGDVKVGRKVEHQLATAGLRVVWDDSPDTRLHIPDFDFRRRGIPAE